MGIVGCPSMSVLSNSDTISLDRENVPPVWRMVSSPSSPPSADRPSNSRTKQYQAVATSSSVAEYDSTFASRHDYESERMESNALPG